MIMPIIDETVFIWVMGIGIGLLVGFSLFRIIKDLNIKIIFAVLYIITFVTIFFVRTSLSGRLLTAAAQRPVTFRFRSFWRSV
jgi:uncharacterized membrane protein YfcA